MKLNKDNLIKNCTDVVYTMAVIYGGELTKQQMDERDPFLTYRHEEGEGGSIIEKLASFCDVPTYQNNIWTISLRRGENSHGVGINSCVVDLTQPEPEPQPPISPTHIYHPPPAGPVNGYPNPSDIEAKLRKELGLEFEIKGLKQEVANLIKNGVKGPGSNDLVDNASMLFKKIWEQFEKPDEQTEIEFMTWLNNATGGTLDKEVKQLAMNGAPGAEVTDEEFKIIVDFFTVPTIKNLAIKITEDSFTAMERMVLKEFGK